MLFKGVMFIVTTGVPFAVTTYHRKTAIFYLPPGEWLGPLGWFLALPSAPRGAISATIWSTACKRVLALFEARFKDLFVSSPVPVPPFPGAVPGSDLQGEPQTVPMADLGKTKGNKSSSSSARQRTAAAPVTELDEE